jgi:hypothetical protein
MQRCLRLGGGVRRTHLERRGVLVDLLGIPAAGRERQPRRVVADVRLLGDAEAAVQRAVGGPLELGAPVERAHSAASGAVDPAAGLDEQHGDAVILDDVAASEM